MTTEKRDNLEQKGGPSGEDNPLENETPKSVLDLSLGDNLPPELQRFKGKTVKDLLQTIQEEQRKITELSEELKAYREAEVQYQTQYPPQTQTDLETEKEIPKKERIEDIFYENPIEGTQKIVEKQVEPLKRQIAMNDAEFAKYLLRQDPKIGKDFQKYEKEIDTIVKTFVDPMYWGNPEVWKRATFQVIMEKKYYSGEELPSEEMKAKTEGEPPAFQEKPTTQTGEEEETAYTEEEEAIIRAAGFKSGKELEKLLKKGGG